MNVCINAAQVAAMVEVNGADCNAESLMLDVVIHGLNLV